MGRRPAGRLRLRESLNAPIATCRPRRHPLPAGRHGEDCGMCHSLAFERQSAAPCARCATAAPAQVIGDLRALYQRRRAAARRPILQRWRARRPGDVHAEPRRGPVRPRPRQPRQPRRSGDPPRLFAGRRLLRLPRSAGAAAAARSTTAFGRSRSPTRYMLHGWFDHREHDHAAPGQPRLAQPPAPAAKRGVELGERSAAARPRQLPRLPWRRA